MRALATLLLTALGVTAVAQPLPPQLVLTINEPDVPVVGGRFEFAKIPELVLVRGIPQIVPLGYYQIDSSNPWPPGDVEGSSDWLSRHPTHLVDATTGVPVVTNVVSYGEQSGELGYAGSWSGDVTVRIKAITGTAQSNPFRIRVLTPTVVWGDRATEINQQKGWNAQVCTGSFAECRSTKFRGGTTDIAPLVVFITTGSYHGQDWYISTRRYTYILGDPINRPTTYGDEISGGEKAMFYVANFNLNNTNLGMTHALTGYPNITILRNLYQCCETGDNNGFANPNHGTHGDKWEVYAHGMESKGMGGVGNTTHPFYVEGRPDSLFDVNNMRMLSSRGSSGVKTTVNEMNVRHSLLHVAQSMEDFENGVCIHPGTSTGCLMHTPVDAPGYTNLVVYANKFVVWRGPTIGVPNGRSGVLSGTIYIRQRGMTIGSDIPNYPNKSWDPPVSSQGTKVPPCYQWDGTATTFVADNFWRDVRKVPLNDHTNPCLFKHYVSFNHFEQLPGSLNVWTIRDDGTYPASATSQFATTVNIFRNHPLWAERSTTFTFGNSYVGYGEQQPKYRTNWEPHVREVHPLSFWPRDPPDQYPRVVDVPDQELPPWFKL